MIGPLALSALLALAIQDPLPGSTANADPHLHTVIYDADRVIKLAVPLGYQTTVILDEGETIESVAVGDAESWQITANERGDHLFVRPLRPAGSTNLTVVTDARVYAFEITGTASARPDSPYVLRFARPGPSPSLPVRSQAWLGRYRLSGSDEARPDAISDDGLRTFIEWNSGRSLPAVFALDDRRREVLVDGHMREGVFVIDAVFSTLIFRSDRLVARADRQTGDRAR